MSDLQTIGFTNQEDDKYGKLTVVDIPHEVATRQPWFNQTLTTVNDAVVRLGIFEGEFPWHKHDEQDEFSSCWTASSIWTLRVGSQSYLSVIRALQCRRARCTGLAHPRNRLC